MFVENFTNGLKHEILRSFTLANKVEQRAFLATTIKLAGKLINENKKSVLLLTFDLPELEKLFLNTYSIIFNENLPVKKLENNRSNVLIQKKILSVLGKLELLDSDNNLIQGLTPELINSTKDILIVFFKTAILCKGIFVSSKNSSPFIMQFDNIVDAMAISGISNRLKVDSTVKISSANISKYFIKNKNNVLNMLKILNAKTSLLVWENLQQLENGQEDTKTNNDISINELENAYNTLYDNLDNEMIELIELRIKHKSLSVEEIIHMYNLPLSKKIFIDKLQKIINSSQK
jgi:DNA-binding protein WhiA